jgi:hypothetical protein
MKELRDGLRGFLQRRIDRRRRNLRGDLREFRDIDSVALSQHHGAKDGVLELADVPRPVEGAEQTQRLRPYRANALAFFRSKSRQKMPRQRRNICLSFPQRWHSDREHM